MEKILIAVGASGFGRLRPVENWAKCAGQGQDMRSGASSC